MEPAGLSPPSSNMLYSSEHSACTNPSSDNAGTLLRSTQHQYGDVVVHDHGRLHQGDRFDFRSYTTINFRLPPCRDRSCAHDLRQARRLLRKYDVKGLTDNILRAEEGSLRKSRHGFSTDAKSQARAKHAAISEPQGQAKQSVPVSAPSPSQRSLIKWGGPCPVSIISKSKTDNANLQIVVALALLLMTGLANNSISHFQVQQVLAKMQMLSSHVQSKNISVMLYSVSLFVFGMLLQRSLGGRTIGSSDDTFMFEDAFSSIHYVPTAYLRTYEIFEGFLFSHYRGSNAISFIGDRSYSVTLGSRTGPPLDLSSTPMSTCPGQILKLVMAVSFLGKAVLCPDCSVPVEANGADAFACRVCRRTFYARSELWLEKVRKSETEQRPVSLAREEDKPIEVSQFAGLRNIDFQLPPVAQDSFFSGKDFFFSVASQSDSGHGSPSRWSIGQRIHEFRLWRNTLSSPAARSKSVVYETENFSVSGAKTGRAELTDRGAVWLFKQKTAKNADSLHTIGEAVRYAAARHAALTYPWFDKSDTI